MLKGQALVVVLLILGMALTVGLAIISRSITEVNVSTVQEEGARALEAAETGIEQAFGGLVGEGGGAVGTLPVSNATYNVASSDLGDGGVYEVPYKLNAGDVATLDLEGYTGNPTNLRVCWGKDGGEVVAAEIMFYYEESGVMHVGRQGYDTNAASRGNGFTTPNNGNCGSLGYDYSTLIQFSSGTNNMGMDASGTPRFVRVRLLYNSTPEPVAFHAQGGHNFVSQGQDITSTGQAGAASQRVRAVITHGDLPGMFDAAVFSGGSLIK